MKAKKSKPQRFLVKPSANQSLSTSVHNASLNTHEFGSACLSPNNISKLEKPIHVFETLVSN